MFRTMYISVLPHTKCILKTLHTNWMQTETLVRIKFSLVFSEKDEIKSVEYTSNVSSVLSTSNVSSVLSVIFRSDTSSYI